jgi:hypothetical protein
VPLEIGGEQVLEHLATGTVPRAVLPCALRLVRAGMEAEAAKAGRARAVAERNVERSLDIRAGIARAIGALPVDAWGAASVVQRRILRAGPDFYGLRHVPDVETIRAVLRERKLRVPELAPAPVPDSLA